jgi:hypothetical protein
MFVLSYVCNITIGWPHHHTHHLYHVAVFFLLRTVRSLIVFHHFPHHLHHHGRLSITHHAMSVTEYRAPYGNVCRSCNNCTDDSDNEEADRPISEHRAIEILDRPCDEENRTDDPKRTECPMESPSAKDTVAKAGGVYHVVHKGEGGQGQKDQS